MCVCAAANRLLSIVQASRSASARFEAMHALSCLALNADDALTALSRERASRTLLHALASFASGLLKSHRLRELNLALNGKPLEEVLSYYEQRRELARYTIDVELPRMEYRVCARAARSHTHMQWPTAHLY